MNEAEKLQPYTEALERLLLRLGEEEGLLGKQLLETDDLTALFPELTQACPRLRAVSARITGLDSLRRDGDGGTLGQ